MFSLNRKPTFACIEACLVMLLLGNLVVTAQQKPATTSEVQQSKLPFVLKVRKTPFISLSLQVKEGRVGDITRELANRLKIPISATPLVQAQSVSLNFKDLALEPALQLLAPQVFIDYQVDPNGQVPIGIFLTAYNEPEPPVAGEAQSNSQAILIEGDTEEGVEPATDEAKKKEEGNPLKIQYINKILNIRARNQPLSLVLLRVGDVLGVPVEMKDDTKDLITTDIVGLPPEDAIQKLSLYVRMYVRADLQRMDRRVLRLVLIAPPGAGQSVQPVKP